MGGLMTMSTYFPDAEEVQLSAVNNALPIHIFDGTQDPVVPETLGHSGNQSLPSTGLTPEYGKII
ncbi:MAG: phospholipase/carboxylesterase [Gammaproteobacteria bacterium]